MKNKAYRVYPISLILLYVIGSALQTSCEKEEDRVTAENIQGIWHFVGEQQILHFEDGSSKDTLIDYDLYMDLGEQPHCAIYYPGSDTFHYVYSFYAPDTFYIDNCPEELLCLYGGILLHKIIDFDPDRRMTLLRTIDRYTPEEDRQYFATDTLLKYYLRETN